MGELQQLLEGAIAVAQELRPEQSWLDLVEPIASALSATAAVAAAGFAIFGINAWRAEAVGRQRAEVATQTLASFYKVRDVFAAVRSPMVWAQEMVPQNGEKDGFSTAADTAPIRRFEKYSDFLATFQTQKYQFAAVFGTEHAALFDRVAKLHNEVVAAALALHENAGSGNLREAFYPIAFAWGANNRIADELEKLVVEAEAVCAPAIQATARR